MVSTIVTVFLTALLTGLLTFWAQERRLKTELRTEFMAEEAARALLESEKWEKLAFSAIKKRLGGFTDDELRKILVRTGTVRFESESGDEELWGLISRNRADV